MSKRVKFYSFYLTLCAIFDILWINNLIEKGIIMKDLKSKILDFLYGQVQKGSVGHIRRGMVEDFEAFILSVLANEEESRVVTKMTVPEAPSEE